MIGDMGEANVGEYNIKNKYVIFLFFQFRVPFFENVTLLILLTSTN